MVKMDKEFINKTVDHIYGNFCGVYRITGKRGEFIMEFPISKVRDVPFDPTVILQNKWDLFETKVDVRKSSTITAITEGFWTCNCRINFVKHVADVDCPLCGGNVLLSKQRLPDLKIELVEGKSTDSDTIH